MTALEVGQVVQTKGTNEYGDGIQVAMVVDAGIDDTHGEYVIAFVSNPSFPKSSHRRRTFVILHTEGQRYGAPQQLGELRRLYLSDLAPVDPFRDPVRMVGYSLKALLAAALDPNENRRADLLAAHRALSEAVDEVQAAERERHEAAARQGAA